MATFGGFIASALGGAAKGYGEGAQMEMKKQAELDLKKQLLDAETERNLRIDDIKRQRDVSYARAETAYNQNPDTIAAAVKADVDKVKALVNSGMSEQKAKLFVQEEQEKLKSKTALLSAQREADLAQAQSNETSQADLRPIAEREAIAASASKDRVTTATAGSTAAAASAVTLAGAQADAKATPELMKAYTEKYKASQEFEKLKAGDATTAQITKAKALAADKDYMAALEKTDLATHAGVIRVAQIKAQGDLEEARAKAADKAPGGGGAEKSLDLARAETSAEKALARALGVEPKEANNAYETLKRRADGGDAAAKVKLAAIEPFKKRLDAASAEWETRKKATGAAPAAAPAAAAPAAAASGARPSLDSFRK